MVVSFVAPSLLPLSKSLIYLPLFCSLSLSFFRYFFQGYSLLIFKFDFSSSQYNDTLMLDIVCKPWQRKQRKQEWRRCCNVMRTAQNDKSTIKLILKHFIITFWRWVCIRRVLDFRTNDIFLNIVFFKHYLYGMPDIVMRFAKICQRVARQCVRIFDSICPTRTRNSLPTLFCLIIIIGIMNI